MSIAHDVARMIAAARLQERERCAKAEPTDEMLRDGIRCFQQQAFDSADPLADWRAFFRIVNAAVIRALPEGE